MSFSPLSITLYIALFDAIGGVKKAEYSGKGQSHPFQKLTDIDHHLIMEAMIDCPVQNKGVL